MTLKSHNIVLVFTAITAMALGAWQVGAAQQELKTYDKVPNYLPRGAVPPEIGCRGYAGRVSEDANRHLCPGFAPGLIRFEETDAKQELVRVRLIPCNSPDIIDAAKGTELARARALFCVEGD